MPTIQGQVGPQQLGSGANATIAQGKAAEVLVSEYQAKYYSLCYAGKVFSTCNQTVATLSTLSSTYTGLLIANPYSSGTNMIVLQCCVAAASAPGGISTVQHQATATVVKVPITTNSTPNTIYNSLIGSASLGVAIATVSGALGTTPVCIRAMGVGVDATGAANPIAFAVDDIAGSMILQPGTYVGLGYVTTAINVIASYHWAEVPQ